MQIRGIWYNGKTSAAKAATLSVSDGGRIEVQGVEHPVSCHVDEINISEQIGKTPRYLKFPDGSAFETKNNALVDQVGQLQSHKTAGDVHSFADRLEKNWIAVSLSLALILALVFWFAFFGAPKVARQIAFALPASVSNYIGRDTLALMDRTSLKPSTLKPARQAELQKLFSTILPEDTEQLSYQLVFRRGGRIGANAFALPDATIVMTDELVNIADDDQQITAVLLHEIGHVKGRHLLRQLIQQTGLAGLITLIVGDVNTASHLVLAVPGILMNASYSRDIEWEADTYALHYMQSHHISPRAFAQMMHNLQNWIPDNCGPNVNHNSNFSTKENQQQTADNTKKDKPVTAGMGYLSTHPPTEERIKRFEDAEDTSPSVATQSKPVPEPTVETIDLEKLPMPLQWLKTSNYPALDSYYASLQQDYQTGKKTEMDLNSGFSLLNENKKINEHYYNEWVSAYPDSYAAKTARGIFYYKMGNEARGNGWINSTCDSQIRAMEHYFSLAVPDLTASLKMTDKPLISAYYLLNIDWYIGDVNSRRKWLDMGNKIDPSNWYIKYAYMQGLRPRWGGSYDLMQSFLKESRYFELSKLHMNKLESVIYADMVSSEEDPNKKTIAMEKLKQLILESEANGGTLPENALTEYVSEKWRLNQYDDAMPALKDLATLKIQSPWIYSDLGWLYIKQNKMKDAWENVNIAANMGDAWAEFSVGKTLYLGCPDVPLVADKSAGLVWIRKSADQGFEEAKQFLASNPR